MEFIVTGSQNAKEIDRSIDRKDIRPVQLYYNNKFINLNFFNNYGKLGISSFIWNPEKPLTMLMSDGDSLFSIDLVDKSVIRYDIEGLKDIHEITLIGSVVYLSNTAYNEVVGFDITKREVVYRKNLSNFNTEDNIDELENYDDFIKDKYHINQIFMGYDKRLYCLVHHFKGVQFLQRVKNKILKIQGNGGVINLNTGERHNLKLAGPHSMRLVGNNYWVCSSKEKLIYIFDKNWELKQKISTLGWGRGSDLSSDKKILIVGNSAKRKRYYVENNEVNDELNRIQFIDIKTYDSLSDVVVTNIEQINNIYTINDSKHLEYLLNLR